MRSVYNQMLIELCQAEFTTKCSSPPPLSSTTIITSTNTTINAIINQKIRHSQQFIKIVDNKILWSTMSLICKELQFLKMRVILCPRIAIFTNLSPQQRVFLTLPFFYLLAECTERVRYFFGSRQNPKVPHYIYSQTLRPFKTRRKYLYTVFSPNMCKSEVLVAAAQLFVK